MKKQISQVCYICNLEKPCNETEFPRIAGRKNRFRTICNKCLQKYEFLKNGGLTECLMCHKNKPFSEFYYSNKSRCKTCVTEENKKYTAKNLDKRKLRYKLYISEKRKNNPESPLLKGAKQRARKYNLEFNLELSDIIIPEYCPVLGIKLFKENNKLSYNSPSIDRIDNSKGYVKGNIAVISWRANRLKGDGNLQDLKQIVGYMEKYQNPT